MKISIIIATANRVELLSRALMSLNKAQNEASEFEFENFVVFNGYNPDHEFQKYLNFKAIVLEQKVHPSAARNVALNQISGEWIYFLDDDAFVPENFFLDFKETLSEQNALVVGGPNITPLNSNSFQKISGTALKSSWGAGPCAKRYSNKFSKTVCDETALILCNLFVHASCFKNKKFGENLFCGEENAFLYALKREGIDFFYNPLLFVYHERRRNLVGFCSQIYKYGVGRGQNIIEFRNFYFFNLLPVLSFFFFIVATLFSMSASLQLLITYGLINLFYSLKLFYDENISIKSIPMLFGIFPLIHLFYVFGILRGLFF